MQSRRTIAARIVALIFAALLLWPGGCFVLLGISVAKDDYRHNSAFHISEDAASSFVVAAVILSVAGLLFWVAFRHRR